MKCSLRYNDKKYALVYNRSNCWNNSADYSVALAISYHIVVVW